MNKNTALFKLFKNDRSAWRSDGMLRLCMLCYPSGRDARPAIISDTSRAVGLVFGVVEAQLWLDSDEGREFVS